MVSIYALGALAIAVTQAAKALGSPLKEILLVCVCVGVLVGSSIVQKLGKEKTGPPLQEGWRWETFDTNGAQPSLQSDKPLPEVLAFPAEPPKGESLGIAIVPGNPGIPHFYCTFAKFLHEQLTPSLGAVTVYIVGYPNFVTLSSPEKEGSDIEDEAAAMSPVLAELRRKHSKGLVLLGHSIGAWVVTQHLIKQYSPSKKQKSDDTHGTETPLIPLAILAMPYLEYHSSGSGKQELVSKLTKLPLFSQLVRFLSLVPLALPKSLHSIIGKLNGVDSKRDLDILQATILEQPHHVRGVLLMVRSELSRLDPSVTPGAGLQELTPFLRTPGRPPVLYLFTHGDFWSPECHAAEVQGMYDWSPKATDVSAEDKVVDLGAPDAGCLIDGKPPPHGFPTYPDYCGRLAELVASHVLARIRDE